MIATLQYGKGERCQLDLPHCTRIGAAEDSAIDPASLPAHIQHALAEPLDFPPLASATVPGDHVVVAIDSTTPMMPQVLAGLVAALADAGIERNQATYVFSPTSEKLAASLQQLADELGIDVRVHDPTDADGCSMVSVTRSGEALRMNREIGEADLVLPVTVAAASTPESPQGKFAGLFPEFADSDTITRLQGKRLKHSASAQLACDKEADEAGWLLGVYISIRVVPGPNDSVAAVVAGEPSAVASAASESHRSVWNQPISEAADLVIATLGNNAEEHTWQSLAQALALAESVVSTGGAIAICSQLVESPGPAVRALAGNRDYAQVERSLSRVKANDTQIALQICRSLERGAVYLGSQLAAGVVEDLGFTPIGTAGELERLTQSFAKIVVLEDAHKLMLDATK